MSDEEEIAKWLAQKGATVCPPKAARELGARSGEPGGFFLARSCGHGRAVAYPARRPQRKNETPTLNVGRPTRIVRAIRSLKW